MFVINERDKRLAHACLEGNKKMVELAISKGANDWDWGLTNACRGGHKEIALLMISKGATCLKWGLIIACGEGHKELAELMISKGANNLQAGLEHACMKNRKALVLLMIEKGANVNGYTIELDDIDLEYLIKKQIVDEQLILYSDRVIKILTIIDKIKIKLQMIIPNDLVDLCNAY